MTQYSDPNFQSLQAGSDPIDAAERKIKAGVNAFYAVAVVSAVSLFFIVPFSEINARISGFAVGANSYLGPSITSLLGISAILVGEASQELALLAMVVGMVLSIIVSGVMALFGFFAGKGKKWSFIAGMVMYILDLIPLALVYLYLHPDWWAIVFRFFILRRMFIGFQALNRLPQNTQMPTTNYP